MLRATLIGLGVLGSAVLVGGMHGRFLAELGRRGVEVAVLSGRHERRLAAAAALIEARWPALRPAGS